MPLALVVEDDQSIRKAAELNLRRFGMAVHTAENGQEAVALVRKNTYDIILMDINMPKMSGLEATKRIRKIQARYGRRCPIIAVSASADDALCFAAGVDDYLAKPVDYDRILQLWLAEEEI